MNTEPCMSSTQRTVTSPRQRYLLHRVLILIAAVSVMAILFKLASTPVVSVMELLFQLPSTPAVANAGHAVTNPPQHNTLPKTMSDLTEGDSGYIQLADIQTHPLLNVYIAETTTVHPAPTPTHTIRITLQDQIIILDPLSVQKALRYVAMGPIQDAHHHIMTSTP